MSAEASPLRSMRIMAGAEGAAPQEFVGLLPCKLRRSPKIVEFCDYLQNSTSPTGPWPLAVSLNKYTLTAI